MLKTLLALVVMLLAAPGAIAQTKHDSHDGKTHAAMEEGVHARAVINTIDGDTANVSHDPIPEIGWPAMTMDLKLLEGAEIGKVSPGDTATMMLEKGSDGVYGIRALVPEE